MPQNPPISPIYCRTATPEDAGQRLDKFLTAAFPDFSRSRVQALIGEGQVKADGRTITDPSGKIKPGGVYTIEVPPLRSATPEPQAFALDIRYEDADLLVINKPPGMTVHPAPGSPDRTLVNALLAHCGNSLSGIGGVARPGIVHRIDKETSGLLVVAKHDAAHRALSAQLAARTLKRTYQAVVWGAPLPRSGRIEGNIGRSLRDRKKMAVLARGGKEAVTHYRTEEIFSPAKEPLAALLTCELETGRTHQIRVHLSHRGHPLVGDPIYGNARARLAKAKKLLADGAGETLEAFRRQALHAFRLALIHPATGEEMTFEAPLPADFIGLLLVLRHLRADQ